MKTYSFKKFSLFTSMLLISSLLLSCNNSSNDGDPRDGLLDNQTSYNVRVDFRGLKISEIPPGITPVRENAPEANMTHQVDISIVDASANVLEVIPYLLPIDGSADNQRILDLRCSWYLSVTGDTDFIVSSGP